MKSCSRSVFFNAVSRSLNPNPYLLLLHLHLHHRFPLPLSIPLNSHGILSSIGQRKNTFLRLSSIRYCSSFPSDSISAPTMTTGSEVETGLEKQFEDFRRHLEDSGNLRERIRAVAVEIESVTRLMHGSLLLVHQSGPSPEVLENAKGKIVVLRELFGKVAEVLSECPGQYYRYNGDWRSETQSVVSLLAFIHWLETGTLLLHTNAEEKLGLHSFDFGLDVEDYLIGICFMSNELPRYVVNRVTAGDYDCPRDVLNFLTDLHTSFRMLNLRNDFLRKKFDGMKYDLRKVEDVYYDVKIRGLGASGTKEQ